MKFINNFMNRKYTNNHKSLRNDLSFLQINKKQTSDH